MQLENQVDLILISLQQTNINRTTSSCSPFGVMWMIALTCAGSTLSLDPSGEETLVFC